MRKNLLAWQWSDYSDKHGNKINFLIHILAIPLFWIGTINLILGFINANSLPSIASAILLFASFALQGVGHKLEKESPNPFLGPFDFITRFVAEQFITFPRFVLSLKWVKLFSKTRSN